MEKTDRDLNNAVPYHVCMFVESCLVTYHMMYEGVTRIANIRGCVSTCVVLVSG